MSPTRIVVSPWLASVCTVGMLPLIPLTAADTTGLTWSALLQSRLELSRSRDAVGASYDANTGKAGRGDDVEGYLRRARLGVRFTQGEHLRANLILAADNAERQGLGDARVFQPLIATVAYEWTDDGQVRHQLKAGLDYPFYNRASFGPPQQQLLPADRATILLLWPRGFGVGYRARGDQATFGVDVQQNSNSAFPGYPVATNAPILAGDSADNDSHGEGLCYTTRLEWSPAGLELGSWSESYVGAEGTGLGLGIDLGYNNRDRVAYGTSTPDATDATNAEINTWCLGLEANLHHDRWSVIADLRTQRTSTSTDDDGPVVANEDRRITSRVAVLQAGYVVVQSPAVWEAAGRFSRIDIDTTGSEATAYNTRTGLADFGSSGWQTELGVNCYLDQHRHKLQLGWLRWRAEEGDGRTDVVRMQHQWQF